MKRKYAFNTTHTILAMGLLVFIIILASFAQYKNRLKSDLQNHAKELLTANSDVAVQNITSKLDSIITDLKNLSSLATYPDFELNKTTLQELLNKNLNYDGTVDIIMGRSLSSLVIQGSLSDTDQAMITTFQKGDNYYFDQTNPSAPKLYAIVSIVRDSTEVGILRCAFELKNIKNLLTESALNDRGEAYLFQASDTSFLYQNFTDKQTCIDLLKKAGVSQTDLSLFKNNVSKGKSGIINYTLEGNEQYAQYYPMTKNGWYLFNIIPASLITQEAEMISSQASTLTFTIIVLMAGLILFILLVQTYSNRKIKQNQDKLLLEKERYRTVLQQSKSCIWEYDITYDIFNKSDPDLGIYTGQTNISDFTNTYLNMGVIHPDDIPVFRQFCIDLKSGKKYINAELRGKDISNNYVWFDLSGTTLYDNIHAPITVIGQSLNIDEYKKELELFRESSTRDSLTKLYNQTTTAEKINGLISDTGSSYVHALFLLDINNFKHINESLGNLFGDALLIELSVKITKLVKDYDVVGRIGGDEFVVFLYDVPSITMIEDLASRVISIFKHIYSGVGNHTDISGNIGISLYPKDGDDFNTLLSKADIALSNAKQNGKDGYSIYSDKTMDSIGTVHQNLSLHAEPSYQVKERSIIDSNIISNTVDILFDAKEIDISINMILSLIGNYYDLSHLFIAEYSLNKESVGMTYEWCMDSSNRTMKEFQNLPREVFEKIGLDNGDLKGVFYTNQINPSNESDPGYYISYFYPQVKGLLHCAFVDNGEYEGSLCAGISNPDRN